MYKIYQAFDASGKSYVGMTKRSLSQRRVGHRLDSKRYDTKFGRAIRSGIKLDYRILKSNIDSKEDAIYWEKFYIKELDSIKNGYNENRGGIGLDRNNLECRRKIAKTLREVYHSKPETRVKHSYERGGAPVFVFAADGKFVGEYSTQVEACEKLGLPKSKVNLVLHGKKKTVKGFVVRHSFDPPTPKQVLSEKNKRIRVYKNAVYQGQWDSIRACAREIHVATLTLRKAMQQEGFNGFTVEEVCL